MDHKKGEVNAAWDKLITSGLPKGILDWFLLIVVSNLGGVWLRLEACRVVTIAIIFAAIGAFC